MRRQLFPKSVPSCSSLVFIVKKVQQGSTRTFGTAVSGALSHTSTSIINPHTAAMTPQQKLLIDELTSKAAEAQQSFATYSQEKADEIFRATALVADQHRFDLAKLAVHETRIGAVGDKAIKNYNAFQTVWSQYKSSKTPAINGAEKLLEPVGPILGIVPIASPTAEPIFTAMLALMTRNAIVFVPPRRAVKSTTTTTKIIHDAAVRAGAPEGCVQCVEAPSKAIRDYLIQHPAIKFLLGAGGQELEQAFHAAGKPAILLGAGNTFALIDETADVSVAVSSIIMSKTFDQGMNCASEQTVVVVDSVFDAVLSEFRNRGAYLICDSEQRALRKYMFPDSEHINQDAMGRTAFSIADAIGFDVPRDTLLLVVPIDTVEHDEPLAREKYSPILTLVRATDFADGCEKIITLGGIGHISRLYTGTGAERMERLQSFRNRLPTTVFDAPVTPVNFASRSFSLALGRGVNSSFSGIVGVAQLLHEKPQDEKMRMASERALL